MSWMYGSGELMLLCSIYRQFQSQAYQIVWIYFNFEKIRSFTAEYIFVDQALLLWIPDKLPFRGYLN